MNNGSKTNQQLVLEIEELRARLDVAQQRLQEANGRTQAEITERKGTERALEERLKFETLLAETSARFVNLPVDRIDGEIEDTQRRICELLDLDRATLWQVCEGEPGALLLTHLYHPQESLPPPERMDARVFLPWATQKVLGGETLVVSKMANLPPEAGRDRESARVYGTKSDVLVPLSVGEGPVFGMLTFAVMREERSWPETVVTGFKLIAQVFANALARKRAEQALRQKTEELDQFFNVSLDLLCIANTDGYFLRLNPSWERNLGYSREELMAKRFLDFVHPDDLDRTHKAVSILSSQQELTSFENRYRCKDGTYRWLEWTSAPAGNLIYAAARDVTERKQAEEALGERLQFERLLSDLSARFVNIPPDRVDSEIEDGLRQILEIFQVDRCMLLRLLLDKASWQITHIASSGDVPTHPAGVDLPRSLYPWAYEKLAEKHEVMSVSRLDDLPAEAKVDRQTCIEVGIRSYVNIPILIGESVSHIIHASSVKSERGWPEELFPRLRLLGEIFVNALQRKQNRLQLEERFQEIENLKQRLERENIYLQEEVKLLVEHTEIVGHSLTMKKVLSQAEQVAGTDSTVLLLGETGTGKELLARAIHSMSLRKDRPLVTVNCASLPPTLIESELFGREKGAYTGAMTKMIGRFEIADGSTLFLDEIGELPLDLQSKLLRVLEQGNFERLGSTKTLRVNVRVIAATNRDIEQEVKDGKFRRDLFYRLNVFPIVIPPLRERPEDIPLLVRAVVKEFQVRMGKEIESIPKKTIQALQSYSWPGNVRELRNLIEHAMILSGGKTLDVHVPKRASSETDATGNLIDMERRHITAALNKTGWRVAGQGGAAEILGLKRTTLYGKIRKLGIKRSSKTVSE
jgi:formate hydrogenlyase transcriptional activator